MPARSTRAAWERPPDVSDDLHEHRHRQRERGYRCSCPARSPTTTRRPTRLPAAPTTSPAHSASSMPTSTPIRPASRSNGPAFSDRRPRPRANALTDFALNDTGAFFGIVNNRDFTTTAAFTNRGDVQIGGGTFNAASITNEAAGEFFGFGTIADAIVNSGTVRASRRHAHHGRHHWRAERNNSDRPRRLARLCPAPAATAMPISWFTTAAV